MSRLSKFFLILGGTFLLLFVALLNGYPLLYSDSATYIYSGIERFVPIDRPITYGLFLEKISLAKSLWYVVFVQNAIMAFVLLEICQLFFKEKLKLYYLVSVTVLMLFTGIGWYTNQIMPDFLAAVLALTLFLLLYSPKISHYKFVLLSIILIISIIVHFSHLLIGIVLIISVLLFEYLWQRKKNAVAFPGSYKRRIIVLALVLSGWLIFPSINYCVEKKFFVSKSSHVFIMAHLADNGMLRTFLHDNCSGEEFRNCKMCAYKDSLPTNLGAFLWEDNGVFKKTGWWGESESEYKKIIYATFKKPKYIFSHIKKTILYAGMQLFKNEIGSGLMPYQKGTAAYDAVNKYFNHELNNLINAKQHNFILIEIFEKINLVNSILNILSLFSLIIIFSTSLYKQADTLSVRLLQFAIITLIVNALVTAGLNSPSERFQARVTWLVPFALMVFIFTNYKLIKENLVKK